MKKVFTQSIMTYIASTLGLMLGTAYAKPSISLEGCVAQNTIASKKEICFSTGRKIEDRKILVKVCAGPNLSGGLTAVVDLMTAGASFMVCASKEYSTSDFDESKNFEQLIAVVKMKASELKLPVGNWEFGQQVQSAPLCSYPALDLFEMLKRVEENKKARRLRCERL